MVRLLIAAPHFAHNCKIVGLQEAIGSHWERLEYVANGTMLTGMVHRDIASDGYVIDLSLSSLRLCLVAPLPPDAVCAHLIWLGEYIFELSS
jgi:hypothetical protein